VHPAIFVVSTVTPVLSVTQLSVVLDSVLSHSGRISFSKATCGSQFPITSTIGLDESVTSQLSLPCCELLTVLLALDVPLLVSVLLALKLTLELALENADSVAVVFAELEDSGLVAVVLSVVVPELDALVVSVVKSHARYCP
jgi:hypothetical protein